MRIRRDKINEPKILIFISFALETPCCNRQKKDRNYHFMLVSCINYQTICKLNQKLH